VTTQERDEDLEQLLAFLRDERGFDFTGYKRPSLSRRVTKRLQERKVAGFGEYRRLLEREPDEFAALFDTILINVTSFFRDAAAWDYVAKEIVPRILEAREPGDPIRMWSTGCATGEEAYTLAIILAEAMGDEDFRRRVKIYATDVDEDALTEGRHASFSPQQVEAVPTELRMRYFESQNSSFVFRSDLRRSVIFGRHDLVQDPPISRIDLLTSRNTLMYFDAETQRRVLANFHFALRDDGYLFLGKSEVLVARSPLFSAVDLKRRVFAKVPAVAARERVVVQLRDDSELRTAELVAQEHLIRDAGFEAAPVAQLVIDRAGRLALANMQARMLFGLSHRDLGTLLQDLELSYRPIELRSRIEQVYSEGHAIALRDVEWQGTGEARVVDIQIAPLVSATGELVGVGISVVDVTRYRRLQEALEGSKREVETAYEELQSTVEELETTNEELQSTNEELETTNEELQSTNEELETMNEELQSTNEELETINDELQQRTDELNDVNSFLEAILGGLSAGVIVVDTELRVQAWNEASEDMWGIRSDEAERSHLLNLDIGLPVDKLRAPLRTALAGERPDALLVDAVNRRGRAVRAAVRVAPLTSDGSGVRGAIVMVETEPATEG
jgi:two-component system CheB/CheR fusion protein